MAVDGGPGVDPLVEDHQVDAFGLQIVGQGDQVLERSAETVELGDDQMVELPCDEQRLVEPRAPEQLAAGGVECISVQPAAVQESAAPVSEAECTETNHVPVRTGYRRRQIADSDSVNRIGPTWRAGAIVSVQSSWSGLLDNKGSPRCCSDGLEVTSVGADD